MRVVNGVACYSELSEILQPEHTALLVVDMQNDFCRPSGWMATQAGRDLSAIDEMVPHAVALVDAARDAGVFVVFIQQTTLPDNASDTAAWIYFKTRDGRTRTDYTLDGSVGQEVISEIEPRPGEARVKKHRPSSFHETELDRLLRDRGIETVVVFGTFTQGCVLATTLDASFHDYYVVLAEDCVQSFSQRLHGVALEFMSSRYDVVPSATIIEEGGWSS